MTLVFSTSGKGGNNNNNQSAQSQAGQLGLNSALLAPWRDIDTIGDLEALIETSTVDTKKPKHEQAFSSRTAGALQLLAKRLRTRA